MKQNNVQMARDESLEAQFKRRYNRDAVIQRGIIMRTPKIIDRVIVNIECKDKQCTLIEKMTDEQLTDTAYFINNGKTFKYKTYLEAEVHAADYIGGN